MGDANQCLFIHPIANTVANTNHNLTMDDEGLISWRLESAVSREKIAIVLREDQSQGC